MGSGEDGPAFTATLRSRQRGGQTGLHCLLPTTYSRIERTHNRDGDLARSDAVADEVGLDQSQAVRARLEGSGQLDTTAHVIIMTAAIADILGGARCLLPDDRSVGTGAELDVGR